MAGRHLTRCTNAPTGIAAVPVHDTAGAVRQVVRGGQAQAAAIAGARCAEIYGGCVLLDNIADSGKNVTRFLLITAAVG
ncbi:MAG: prephenate dehydratase domain-containing protein [Gammaproteobacteria bacterium]